METPQSTGCVGVAWGTMLVGLLLSIVTINGVNVMPAPGAESSVEMIAPDAAIWSPTDLDWDAAMYDLSQGDYSAPRAAVPPMIDGVGDDSAWAVAEWRAIQFQWLGDTPLTDADFMGRYKIVWTPDRLYYLVEIYDDMLSDVRADPFDQYWEDDTLEVFVDEDQSGGSHRFDHSAFAYHISLSYDVVDLGITESPILFNDHIEVQRGDRGRLSTWEFSVLVYDDSYQQFSNDNVPVELEAGKVMGFALAYCDSDETGTREHFIGTYGGPNALDAWLDAGLFGTLTLIP
ncbi:MAG: sugar-binding protein [Chloroflexi bacterium]|nr:sugar-binding protein [Chloroflexota bacterium]